MTNPRTSSYSLSVKKGSAGLGLFTHDNIRRDKFVIEYIGDLLTNDEADQKLGRYLFEVNSKWVVDGSDRTNIARYINHSCRPNCEVDVRGKRIFIYAIKNIKAGEELTYDYGKEYFDDIISKKGCRCIKHQAN